MLDSCLLRTAEWFEKSARDLPWRRTSDPYRIWVSEIMLQQTQVSTVIPYFDRFIARFPTVEALAEADEAEVLRHWAGLGYYSRARHLREAAKALSGAGRWPTDRPGWEALAGIGRYTSGAILSIAFNQPEAILDGNVERVVARLRKLERGVAYKSRLWRVSGALLRAAFRLGIEPRVFNQALMELGATICGKPNPNCERCPLAPLCRARRDGVERDFPRPRPGRSWIEIRETRHCVAVAGKVLLEQDQAARWRKGLWDLPAFAPPIGELEALETVEQKYCVTRHRVSRRIRVWKPRKAGWQAGDSAASWARPPGGARWVTMRDPEVPVGGPVKRFLKTLALASLAVCVPYLVSHALAVEKAWFAAETRLARVITDADIEKLLAELTPPDFFEELRLSRPIQRSFSTQRGMRGKFSGAIRFLDGSNRSWEARFTSSARVEGGKLKGEIALEVSESGRVFAKVTDLKALRKFPGGSRALALDLPDGFCLQLYYSDTRDALIGNLFQKNSMGSYQVVGRFAWKRGS